jgi:hypothetical protein
MIGTGLLMLTEPLLIMSPTSCDLPNLEDQTVDAMDDTLS